MVWWVDLVHFDDLLWDFEGGLMSGGVCWRSSSPHPGGLIWAAPRPHQPTLSIGMLGVVCTFVSLNLGICFVWNL